MNTRHQQGEPSNENLTARQVTPKPRMSFMRLSMRSRYVSQTDGETTMCIRRNAKAGLTETKTAFLRISWCAFSIVLCETAGQKPRQMKQRAIVVPVLQLWSVLMIKRSRRKRALFIDMSECVVRQLKIHPANGMKCVESL